MAIKIPRRDIVPQFIFIIILLALILGIVNIIGSINEKNATEYSVESKLNDSVYAYIVSITPESATTKASNRTSKSYEGFFCSCKTENGLVFKAYIDSSRFDTYIQPTKFTWRSVMPGKVEFDTPLRIYGKIVKYKDIVASPDESLVFNIYKSDLKTN